VSAPQVLTPYPARWSLCNFSCIKRYKHSQHTVSPPNTPVTVTAVLHQARLNIQTLASSSNWIFPVLKLGDRLNSSVGIVARQRDRNRREGGRLQLRDRHFLISKAFGPTMGPSQPYSMGIRRSVPRVTRQRRENESPPSSAEGKNEWSYPSNPIGVHGVVFNCLKTKINLNYI
jgi:hypothetical protein